MKHIIREFNDEALSFKDSIKLESSNTEHAAIRIEMRSYFKGETTGTTHRQIAHHITKSQALQIIADLSKLLDLASS